MPEINANPTPRPKAVVDAERAFGERLDEAVNEVVAEALTKLTEELDELEARATEREVRAGEALATPPLRPLREWLAADEASHEDGEAREKRRLQALEELALAKADRAAADAKREEIETYVRSHQEHSRLATGRLGAELQSLAKAVADAKRDAGLREED
jgi:hypothetical protein